MRRWPDSLVYEPWYDKSMSIELAGLIEAGLEHVEAQASRLSGNIAIADKHLCEAVGIWRNSLALDPAEDVGLESDRQEAGGD